MDNKLLKKLIIDDYFNIYNRNGFEYILSKIDSSVKIFLLDFDNVKKMNDLNGYKYVNKQFKDTFKLLKSDYIIGRAFSGDEIFFCTKNINDDISKIKIICDEKGLTFVYVSDILEYNNRNIKNFLNKLINNFHK